MKDKEKQIEEIAKRIHIATDLYYIDCIKVATYLFEKDNCRIIDKDSVVLTNDNAEELAHLIVTSPQMQSVMSDLIKAWQKETAEKILKWLKGHLSCMGYSIVEAYFKEQFGVEIKE